MEYRIIDADSHTNEPAHVWQSRVPEAMKERNSAQDGAAEGRQSWLVL